MTIVVGTCPRCASPIEQGDLRCAICAHIAPTSAAEHAQTVVEVLRCHGCGAAVAYDARAQAPTCAFCDSVMEVEAIEDPMEQAQAFLPFAVRRAAAHKAIRSWLATLGFFRPSDLSSAARLESVRPLWWVGWVCDVETLVSWTADSDAGSRKAEWAPHAGQVKLEFNDLTISASRGLEDDEVAQLLPHYQLQTARPDTEDAPSGAVVEHFDVQRSVARHQIAAALEERAKKVIEQRHLPGNQHRNLQVECLHSRLVTRRYAFPAWVMSYRYGDELYRAVVGGQDPSRVVGEAPYSTAKIVLVVGAVLLVAALVVFLLGSR